MTDMNAWIRARHRSNVASMHNRRLTLVRGTPTDAPVDVGVDTDAPATTPGNAGNGTGAPPLDIRTSSQRMSDFIRRSAGR